MSMLARCSVLRASDNHIFGWCVQVCQLVVKYILQLQRPWQGRLPCHAQLGRRVMLPGGTSNLQAAAE